MVDKLAFGKQSFSVALFQNEDSSTNGSSLSDSSLGVARLVRFYWCRLFYDSSFEVLSFDKQSFSIAQFQNDDSWTNGSSPSDSSLGDG